MCPQPPLAAALKPILQKGKKTLTFGKLEPTYHPIFQVLCFWKALKDVSRKVSTINYGSQEEKQFAAFLEY